MLGYLEQRVFVMIVVLFLSGCVSQSGSVTANQDQCCLPPSPASYDIRSVQVPGFMQDMVEVSLHVTMQTLGYTHRRDDSPDLYISAVYQQLDVSDDTEQNLSLSEPMPMVDEKQFVARVNIRIVKANGAEVWSGHVQRLHTVGPGGYMHRGHAANSIAQALVELIRTETGQTE